MAQPIPFGDYELIERIAEGGISEVWRARSRGAAGFQKTLVIKRVLPSLMARPAFAELLVREAKIAARLSHPNIVQIYDLGEEGGGYFIAMEYLEGRDLAAALSYRGGGEPLGLTLRLWIAREVARALDFAHRARGDDGKPLHIVHRDISPQNGLLGFQGEVKVADFGIARADEPGLGRGEDPRVLRGKYAYMSPEQARGEPLDRRSDLFSLGVLLFELVTRRRMYQGLTQPQILDAVRRGRMPSWRAAVGDASLVGVIERALALSRDDRYGSAAEVHAELGRVIAERREPVGPAELAAAMATMFPMQERISPNKLRVDVLLRAYEDATTARDQGRPASRPPPDETAAMPGSVRARAERHRVALLVTAARPGDDEALAEAAEATGGRLVEAAPSLRVVLFGVPPVERPVAQAARGALELRRRLRISGPARVGRVPAVAIVRAVAREQEGELLPLDEPDVERARRLLGDTEAGDLRVEEGLEAELGRDFVLRLHRQGVSVEGFRSRRERSTQRRSPLVGRQSILRELTGRMADAAKGQGGVVHLVGEAGIGKSRLLAELASASAPAAFTFLRARCDESELERPLGALSDLAHDLCGIEPEDMPRERFAKLERLAAMGVRPEHVRAIGGLVGLAYPFAAQRPMRPRSIEVALALHDALVCLARDARSDRRAGRAVVLAIEDVQWMDEVSRQVFPLLVGKPPAALVLLTRRPGLSGPWPEAERTIRLGPIDLEATIQLLRATLGAASIAPALAEAVRRESGGAPGWIEQLAPLIADRLAGEGGSARPPSILPIPDAAAAGVAAQTGRLRPLDRSMLRVAAALEGDADVELLFAAEGLVGGTGRGPLRRLLSRHLLVADTPQQARAPAWGGDEADVELPARVRLPSGLFARALLAELDEAELSRLHGRIAATLERLGAAATLEGAER
ncbi:MAG: protein kinase, partial [Sandaracinaceae bacterium]|nr:protein kinase [Sandaracinaceae bacterium]